MRKVISYIIPVLLIVVFLTTLVILNTQISKENYKKEEEKFRRFNSLEEIKSFINNYKKSLLISPPQFLSPPPIRSTEPSPIDMPTSELGSETQSPYYSRTNVQVEGIDEADIVKTDGKFIYTLTTKEVTIIKAYPVEETKLISKIPLDQYNKLYNQIFLYAYKDKLVIIYSSIKVKTLENEHRNNTAPVYILPYRYPEYNTGVLTYDIKDKANPILEWNVTFKGFYISSRLIEDNLYIITGNPIIEEVILPEIYSNDKVINVQPKDIYYTNHIDIAFQFVILARLNIVNKELEYNGFLLGITNAIYVSFNNIYITQYIFSSRWLEERTTSNMNRDYTAIHRINIQSGLKYEATGKVPGFVLNQFSMDEYKGYFRITTTSISFTTLTNFTTPTNPNVITTPPPFSVPQIPITSNNIYILDMNLEIVGKLENIEIGERIFAARFIQDKCYLVTFRQIDPFFVIDLSDVEKPKILGYLKIPGFSTYLHPINETLILGIGRENQNEVKISLFDVRNFENPKEISKIVIGNETQYAYSEALYNHKVFLFDSLRKLLILPFTIYNYLTITYNSSAMPWISYLPWQGVLVFEIKDKIYLKGNITHINYKIIKEAMLNKTINNLYEFLYYLYESNVIHRALFIEDFLYTISDSKVKINNIYSLEEIKEIYI